MKILLKGGRVINPENKFDAVADVLVEDGKIVKITQTDVLYMDCGI